MGTLAVDESVSRDRNSTASSSCAFETIATRFDHQMFVSVIDIVVKTRRAAQKSGYILSNRKNILFLSVSTSIVDIAYYVICAD